MKENNISELRPGARPSEAPSDTGAIASRRYARRSKSQRAERTIRRLQLLVVVLAAVVIIVGLAFGVALSPLKAERDELRHEVLRLERDLTVANDKVAMLSAEIDELVTTRIPGLQRLRYDETIAVEDKYLRNILFTLTVQEGQPSYEFRVVMSNEDLVDVIPNVSVLLFNDLGIQLGAARISLDTLASDTGSFKLSPGDVRSYSGKVELSDSGEPIYYVLQVD